MKILSASQIQEWDAFTIQEEQIPSIDLMERAAMACLDNIITYLNSDTHIFIFCGKGNNGGDGLAIARILLEKGFPVSMYIVELGTLGTTDFQTNLHRLHAVTKEIHFIQNGFSFPEIASNDIIIDAIVGSGLTRPLEGLYAKLVEQINTTTATIFSIDLPTGMYCNQSSKGNTIIKAHHTLSFQTMKLCFLARENNAYLGALKILDIQLATAFIEALQAPFDMLEFVQVVALLKKRNTFSHKGDFGHALMIAGSSGKMGAALLSAKACLRAGVGLVTVAIPENTDSMIHIGLPEAMVLHRDDTFNWDQFATIGIGPGLGTDINSEKLVYEVLLNFKKAMVIDADALNVIAKNETWFSMIPKGSILTPHPKEFDRLFGKTDNEFERWQKAKDASLQLQCTILVKGHYTLIATNGKGWFNNTGNAGLAKGGSGDVLTGIITAFLAQGYDASSAAILGVYVHGLAADLSLNHQSMESMMASDLIDHLGEAFHLL